MARGRYDAMGRRRAESSCKKFYNSGNVYGGCGLAFGTRERGILLATLGFEKSLVKVITYNALSLKEISLVEKTFSNAGQSRHYIKNERV